MVGLRWLWLDGLAMDRLPDFGSRTELIRVDCTNMRFIRCPSRSPTPLQSRVCASADTIDSADSSTNTNTPPELRG
ncbi:hypothetical protein Pa4123_77360 [Phytohabitans aurantiacus]|uniref:Uncharacterized protein n=1 Tax=Phytohabitans aurantiacus TaxID=3016789 RepID=A0ABQ5R7U9_9ACTN|nr:hypothetical protein Pa4123_77360 [Phytohabitans aurantiacus]